MYQATGLTGWQRAAQAVSDAAARPQPTQATRQVQPQTPQPQVTAPLPEDELRRLTAQAEAAAATLDHVRQRLAEIAGGSNAPASLQQGSGDQ